MYSFSTEVKICIKILIKWLFYRLENKKKNYFFNVSVIPVKLYLSRMSIILLNLILFKMRVWEGSKVAIIGDIVPDGV